MAGMIGADVEALERLAGEFDSGAEELRELSRQLSGAIDAAHDWRGSDAERCKTEWGAFAHQQMTSVADALEGAGRLLAQNAEEQERASAADSVGAAAGYGLVAFGKDLKAIVQWIKKPLDALGKARELATFLRLLQASRMGRLADPAALAKALDVFRFGSKSGLSGIMGKLFLPLTIVDGVIDAFSGGGYDGWRGTITHLLGGFGAAGALGLLVGGSALVASFPLLAGAAATAVTAYGLWSAGNWMVDNFDSVRDGATRAWGAVTENASRAWEGASRGVESALGWARGLLGTTARPAPAGV